ncbi:MAG: hypothetical protein JWN44_41 [Myxococcales bacterium]|nr:hypothetical protein [Myxococcales bacterium]
MAPSTLSLLVLIAALIAAAPARAQRTVSCSPARVLKSGAAPTRVWRLGKPSGPVPLTLVIQIGSGVGSFDRTVTVRAVARPTAAGDWTLAGDSVSVTDPGEAPFFRFGKELTGRLHIDPDGRISAMNWTLPTAVSDPREASYREATAHLLDMVAEIALGRGTMLPSAPVGTGARWRATSEQTNRQGAQSATMKNALDWRLVRVEGTRATLAVAEVADVAPLTVEGKRMSAHGEIGGGAIVDAARPLPVEWTAHGFVEMHMEPNPPDRVTMNITLRTATEPEH